MEGITMGFHQHAIPRTISVDKGTPNHFDITNVWFYNYDELFPFINPKTIAVFKVKIKKHEKDK